MTTGMPWCDDHNPIPRQDALPAHCDVCGFDRSGRAWDHGPGGYTDLRVAAVHPVVEPTDKDLTDMAVLREMHRERLRSTADYGDTTEPARAGSGTSAGLMQWIPSTWGEK